MKRFDSFLRSSTAIGSASLCPEVRLHLADDLAELWHAQETWLGLKGLSAPFWGIAWVGGQGLARHVLDHPEVVRGLSVLDLGSGSGLCAIAAAMAGARSVEAADIDPYALQALSANARLNNVRVTALQGDLIGSPPRWDVVLAGDLWYERFLAERVTGWLAPMAQSGTAVLLGDCSRAFFPRGVVHEVARYAIASAQGVEREASGMTKVWQLGRQSAMAEKSGR